MADLNPEGIAQDGSFFGQKVRLTPNDVAVDTDGNERAFATPQGQTGFVGNTGLVSAAQGTTGVAYYGATGVRGITGVVGPTGINGLQGETGSVGTQGFAFGLTGLQGATGVASTVTGITGDTGFRGSTGVTGSTGLVGVGLQGVTGLANDFQGVTGLQGDTGINAQIQGVTGLAGFGATGIRGATGLTGNTGISGTAVIEAISGNADTLSVTILANTLSENNQQLDFEAVAFTADDDNPTTVTLTLGSTTIFTKTFGLLSDVCRLTGTIINISTTSQIIGTQLIFDSGTTYCVSASASENLATDLQLLFSVSSGGVGATVTQLVVSEFGTNS